MSPQPDRTAARAYRGPAMPVDEPLACVVCGEDCVATDALGRCADCAPADSETVAEWSTRVAVRRVK